MDIHAFIFDMDGTLVDNMPFHNRTWLDLLAESGVQIDIGRFHHEAAGKTNPEILRQYLGTHLTEAELAAYARRKEELYRDAYRPHRKALAGLHAFLQAAQQQHIPMALATSAGKTNIDFVLSGIDAKSYFSVIVGGEDVQRGKPDPEIFLLTAQRLGVPSAECLVFEDAPAGIEAAHRAGMKVVLLSTSLAPSEWEHRPDILRVVPDYTTLHPADFLTLET